MPAKCQEPGGSWTSLLPAVGYVCARVCLQLAGEASGGQCRDVEQVWELPSEALGSLGWKASGLRKRCSWTAPWLAPGSRCISAIKGQHSQEARPFLSYVLLFTQSTGNSVVLQSGQKAGEFDEAQSGTQNEC